MRLISVNNLEFMVDWAGKGAPILFIGGTGGDLRRKPNMLDSILSKEFEVVSFDQRGMGQSSKPAGPYTMFDYAQDTLGIMDAIGWFSAHITGFSFGGMVAQELAIRFPDRVRSLALVATTAGGAGGSSYPVHEFTHLEPYEHAKKGLEVADKSFTKRWQAEHPEEALARIEQSMAVQAEYMGEPKARSGMAAQLVARSMHDTYDRLPQIKAPTLVLAGMLDGQAPMDSQKKLANKIPFCSFKTVGGSHGEIYKTDQIYEYIVQHIKHEERLWKQV